MKCFLLKEEDFQELLNKIELEYLRKHHWHGTKQLDITDMHRTFHYVVTKWIQERGGSGLRG